MFLTIFPLGMILITGTMVSWTLKDCGCNCSHCWKDDDSHCLYCNWKPSVPMDIWFEDPRESIWYWMSGARARARTHAGAHEKKQ